MKLPRLAIKALAASCGVRTDTLRRAARVGQGPCTHVGTASRVALRRVLAQIKRNAQGACRRDQPAHRVARRQPGAQTPPTCKTGALFPGDAS